MKVSLFSDGRPGHEKQSLGIVQALQRYIDVSLEEVAVVRRRGLAELAAHLLYLLHLDRSSYHHIDPETELIIGTGSRTHIPMLAAKRKTGAKVITCMTPGAHLRQRFDLCFIPYHDNPRSAENIVVTVGPPTVSTSSAKHDPCRRLILIGGADENSHVWDSAAVADYVMRLMMLDGSSSWTISSSPRTPADTEDLIKTVTAEAELVSFVPFSATAPGWLEQQYRINGWVWVTADSISMVYEALSAGCRVGIIPVVWKRAANKFQRSLDYLLDKDLIVLFDQYFQGSNQTGGQERLDEADRCAREIVRRWWPNNLP